MVSVSAKRRLAISFGWPDSSRSCWRHPRHRAGLPRPPHSQGSGHNPAGSDDLDAGVGEIASGLADVLDALRDLSRGIHPAVLSTGGLGPALKTLARRAPIPVEVDVRLPTRPSERVEVAIYYVVAEALTNVAKHGQASVVVVEVEAHDGGTRVSVSDDGVGGADPSRGSGLLG
jgi:signal transduction histidine kinase